MFALDDEFEPKWRRRNVTMILATGCFCMLSGILITLIAVCSSGILDAHRGENDDFEANYAFIEKLCNSLDKTLPLPQSQEEEDKFATSDSIFKFAKEKNCRYIFFGYKANASIRYRSLDGTSQWPTLRANLSVGEPTSKRDCYQLSFMSKKFELLSTVRCDAKQKWNLILLTTNKGEDECFKHRYRCAQMYDSTTNSITENFNAALNSSESFYAMMPLDINQIPEGLVMSRPSILPAVAMAVQYDFRYEYRGIAMPYKSTTFTVIDPEYDCIAFDTETRKIVTINCETRGCPVCL